MSSFLPLLLATGLDYWLAEPPNIYHPLALFGRYAQALKNIALNGKHSENLQRLCGALAWIAAVAPLIWLIEYLKPADDYEQLVYSTVLLYFCMAARSLQQHALAVYATLLQDDLQAARQRVASMVSRDCQTMSPLQARNAAIESVLENGADAVMAPLFWFAVLGPSGAVAYRLINTLDAMWGYKTAQLRYFGWMAARADDLANLIPARLTAFSYAVLGQYRAAMLAWQHQSDSLDSPNAGPVMTAGAAALNLRLGGPAQYHGQIKAKPYFGGTQNAVDADIPRACALVYRCVGLWLAIFGLLALSGCCRA
jgi:adenosylcobinamide-phosphate synthase